jgi:hypothetical protein
MPPASSKRYQSKVFNFFNQQSQRLGQKLDQTIRSVQTATRLSLEAVLLPLYQVLQPDKLLGNILQPPTKTNQPQLKSHTPQKVDAPIQRLLEVIKNLPSAAVTESQTSQNLKANLSPLGFLGKVWGKVSTQLGFSQSSVNNINSADTLQNHIPSIKGIAVKIETRNLVLVGENNKIFDVLTIPQQKTITENINQEIAKLNKVSDVEKVADEQAAIPKIERLLNKLTNTNETSVTDISEPGNQSTIKTYPGKIIAFLDQVLAKLESKSIVPIQNHSQEIINILVDGKPQGEITVNSQSLKKPNLSISEIIEAAINYFFGGRKIPKIAETETFYELPNQPVRKFTETSQIQTSENTDSWLTWSDLYGEVEIQSPQKQTTQTATKTTENNSYVNIGNAQNTTETKQPKLNPDWIETKAIFMGYEKHPLEQILEWLDHIMVWVEMIFLNMVYFCKGLFQLE